MKKYPIVLSIAGSDPSGGAGIQADIKSVSATGSYAATAITAVTVQNTVGVREIHEIPVRIVEAQIEAVLEDIGADVVKIGMLGSVELIRMVRRTLERFNFTNIVLDPVMVATSSDRLIGEQSVPVLANEMAPFARVITPNVPEAEVLCGRSITSDDDLEKAALDISDRLGSISGRPVSVLMKAGHLSGEDVVDYFYNAEQKHITQLRSGRIISQNTHGTGCSLSSAFASFLARGYELDDAASAAKKYVAAAIESGKNYLIGHGHGPINHFFQESSSPVTLQEFRV